MTYAQLRQDVQQIINLAADQQAAANGRTVAAAQAGDRSGMGVVIASDAANPDKLKKNFQWIDQLFQSWYQLPDPAAYQGPIDDVTAALAPLSTGPQNTTDPIDKKPIAANTALSHINDANYLQSWTGQAAVNFKHNFADPFLMVAGNQFLLLCCLKGALEAQQAMWKATRDDIDNIAHKTADVLNHLGMFSESDEKFVFSVIGAIGAIGVTVASGGTAAAVTLSAIGAASATGGALFAGIDANSDDAKQEGIIKGSTVAEVTQSMKDQVDKLKQHVITVEKAVEQKLQAIIDMVNGNKKNFVADRPSLADYKNGGLDSQDGLGTDN